MADMIINKRSALVLMILLLFAGSYVIATNVTSPWTMSVNQHMNEFIDCLELSGGKFKFSLTDPGTLYFCRENGDGPSQVPATNMSWISHCMFHIGVRFQTAFVTCDSEEMSIADYVPRDRLIKWADNVGYPERPISNVQQPINGTARYTLDKRTGYYHIFVSEYRGCESNDMHVAETDQCSTHFSPWSSVNVHGSAVDVRDTKFLA
ncbi:hypothetical protein V1506DRAFT_540952 [Lipomyces tetrasporus]